MSDKKTTRNRLFAVIATLLVIVVGVQVYLIVQTRELKAATHEGLTTLPALPAVDSTKATPPDSIFNMFDDNWMFGHGHDPFAMMRGMQERMDRMFAHAFANMGNVGQDSTLAGAYAPSLDLSDRGDRYVVKVDLPGINQAALNVSVENDVLKIEGKREEVSQQKDADGHVIQSERRFGQFARAVDLPGPVDAAKMQTSYKKGVLTIELPKKGGRT